MSSESNTTKYLVSCPPQPQYIHQAGLRAYGCMHIQTQNIPSQTVETVCEGIHQLPLRGQRRLEHLWRTDFPIILNATNIFVNMRHLMLKILN